MNDHLARYIEIVHRSRQLLRPEILPDVGREETLAELLRVRDEQRRLMKEGRDILNDPDIGLCLPAEQLTEDQNADLIAFSDALGEYSMQVDNPLKYRVNLKLRERAMARGDLPELLRANYVCGLTLYYLNRTLQECGLNTFSGQVVNYFQENADYLPNLRDFDPVTRGYILRSVGNVRLGRSMQKMGDSFPFTTEAVKRDEDIAYLKKCLDIYRDPAYRDAAPEFNWDSAVYVMHLGVTVLLTLLRIQNDPDIAEMVYESAKIVYENAQEASRLNNRMASARACYVWNAAQFHTGRITLEKMLEELEKSADTPPEQPYDANDIFHQVMVPLYFLEYQLRYGTRTEQNDRRCAVMRRRVIDYVMGMPHSDSFSVLVTLFSNLYLLFDNRGETEDRVLELLLSFDKPLCVHGMMTGRLACTLLDMLTDKQPEIFAEEYRTVSMLRRSRERLQWRTYHFAVYHDFGMLNLLDQLAPYTRDLTPEERLAEQAHPYLGYCQLRSFDQTQSYADAVLGHELFFNGKDGYPAYCKRREGTDQILMDVVAVADAFDALTDPVAAIRTTELSFEAAREQLIAGAGIRFAPYVTALLQDDASFAQLCRVAREERLETYYFVYHQEQGGKDEAPEEHPQG